MQARHRAVVGRKKDEFEMASLMPAVRGMLRKGVGFLLQQASSGYSESIHYMCLPRITNGVWEDICYPTDFFPRMLVLDSLLDSREFDSRITEGLVQKEIEYIRASKHQTVNGGWNYIPSFPDLPPDADDLALVLQLLFRSGGKKEASICDGALEVLSKYNLRDDGSISTWVIDLEDTSESNMAVLRYSTFLLGAPALVPGGGGADVDVLSNLLYALALYDAKKYMPVLRKGAHYLETHQQPEGYWESRWYWGPYYATFKSTCFLSLLSRPGAVRPAIEFIVDTQLEDGGWGENMKSSDDLNTALALMSLLSSNVLSDSTARAITKGAGYLWRAANADGSWRNVRLERTVTSRRCMSYGSQTTTTSFCVKALAGIRKRAEGYGQRSI